MGYQNYLTNAFNNPNFQHNVMAFVGNGFDVQVMHDYQRQIDTRYTSFYHFLKLRSFNQSNPILQEMERLRDEKYENWSDVEGAVGTLLADRRVIPAKLINALREIQGQFAEFLDLAVPSRLLTELGADSMERHLATNMFAGFLGDLDENEYRGVKFLQNIQNWDVYNFVFVNFNYTPLLDDFIYLDQGQFDPLPLKTVDRNFDFEGNPKRFGGAPVTPGDHFWSYLMTEVLHPHGQQSIPRSLLFGIDEPAKSTGNRDETLRLAKPFWAQNKRRYQDLFPDTELFIVFGCSLGESDRWWWRHIADALGHERRRPGGAGTYWPELIIYWYNGGTRALTKEWVRERFFDAAGVSGSNNAVDYVHVVLHDESTDRLWLNTLRTAPLAITDPISVDTDKPSF